MNVFQQSTNRSNVDEQYEEPRVSTVWLHGANRWKPSTAMDVSNLSEYNLNLLSCKQTFPVHYLQISFMLLHLGALAICCLVNSSMKRLAYFPTNVRLTQNWIESLFFLYRKSISILDQYSQDNFYIFFFKNKLLYDYVYTDVEGSGLCFHYLCTLGFVLFQWMSGGTCAAFQKNVIVYFNILVLWCRLHDVNYKVELDPSLFNGIHILTVFDSNLRREAYIFAKWENMSF